MAKLTLITILRIEHVDSNGRVLWYAENLPNILHAEGEEYILKAAFSDTTVVPANFYFGCDNRSILARSDTMADITGEPTVFGYTRQVISSDGEIQVAVELGGYYIATSPILLFSASGGDWGPVSNLFMTTESGGSGELIASVPFSQEITVEDGTSLNVQMRLSLQS